MPSAHSSTFDSSFSPLFSLTATGVGMCAKEMFIERVKERGTMWVLLSLPRFFFLWSERGYWLKKQYPCPFFSVQQACRLRHRLARSVVSFPLPRLLYPSPFSTLLCNACRSSAARRKCNSFSSNKFHFLFFLHILY